MKEIITSPNNPTIKLIKSLQIKKYRDTHGLYIVEGLKMVQEALGEKVQIHTLIFSESFSMEELSFKDDEHLIPRVWVTPNLFKEISDVQSPQGVIAILKKQEHHLSKVREMNSGLLVVLDRVQDPGNMGTIIRTVDGAGGIGVVLLKGCVDPYNQKTVRATMGSVFRVPIIQVEETDNFFQGLTKKGGDIIVSSMEGINIFNWESRNPRGLKALVIGNESQGISSQVHQFATSVVSIPIIGGAESLNASVAAGIMIYEIMQREGNMDKEIS